MNAHQWRVVRFCMTNKLFRDDLFLLNKNITVLGQNKRNLRLIPGEDLFLGGNTIIFGQKVRNPRLISSEDLFFLLENNMNLGQKFCPTHSILHVNCMTSVSIPTA